MKQLICFDLDNTLIKSNHCHIKAWQDSFRVMKWKVFSISKIEKHLKGQPHIQIARELAPKNATSREIFKFNWLESYFLRKKYYKLARKIKGVDIALKKLRKNYDLGLISNCNKKDIFALLKGSGLDKKLFKFIIGANELPCSKPSPAGIIMASRLEKHRVLYYIGDSIVDILSAKRAHVKAIGVLTGRYTKNQLAHYKPWKIIKSVAELPRVLL